MGPAHQSKLALGLLAAALLAVALGGHGDARAQAPPGAVEPSAPALGMPSSLSPPPPAPPSPAPAPLSDPGPAGTTAAGSAPFIRLDVGGGSGTGTGGDLVPALKIILLLAAMTFLPALLLATTSFTRIIIVLALVRQGIGVQQLPPNRILVALALFLTAFTMAPTFSQIGDKALTPYQAGTLTELQALEAASVPLRTFMLSHVRESDLMLFVELNEGERPETAEDVSTLTLIPAFILSELKTAFQMGALLFLPFLVIDLVVGSILMSMGMMMLPPATISLPLKILVFVAVDGWSLVIGALARSLSG